MLNEMEGFLLDFGKDVINHFNGKKPNEITVMDLLDFIKEWHSKRTY